MRRAALGVEAGRQDDAAPFRADLEKYYRIHFGTPTPSLSRRAYLWARHTGLHCVAVYRLSRYVRRVAARSRLVAFPLLNLARALELGLELVHHVSISADVGPGFYVGHAGMIFIGPTVIGRNFSVTHAVTIGVGIGEGARGTPVVGDDVWVGTASVLSGPIRVGDGVTVANGTMLSRTVPAGALVAGNPGRVVMLSYDNAPLMGRIATTPRPPAPSAGAPDREPVPTARIGGAKDREAVASPRAVS
jgi:serine O-acetyltransferase